MAVRGILRGSRIDRQESGWVVVERWEVTGLASLDSRARNYIAATTAGLPQYGEPHPHVPNIFVTQVSLEDATPADAIFSITFGPRTGGTTGVQPDPSDPGLLEIGASLVNTTTQFDITGNQITLTHTYTSGPKTGITETQGGSVDIQVAQGVVRRTRLESSANLSKALEYSGTVNDAAWQGYAARTWYCLPITYVSTDGGETYQTTYELHYRAETWDARIAFIDPDTNEIPGGLVEGRGIKSVRVIPEKNFFALGISL